MAERLNDRRIAALPIPTLSRIFNFALDREWIEASRKSDVDPRGIRSAELDER